MGLRYRWICPVWGLGFRDLEFPLNPGTQTFAEMPRCCWICENWCERLAFQSTACPLKPSFADFKDDIGVSIRVAIRVIGVSIRVATRT